MRFTNRLDVECKKRRGVRARLILFEQFCCLALTKMGKI